jgi:hypothetical protein
LPRLGLGLALDLASVWARLRVGGAAQSKARQTQGVELEFFMHVHRLDVFTEKRVVGLAAACGCRHFQTPAKHRVSTEAEE